MKIEDVLTRSFKRLRHELGHDRPRDTRPMWLIRLSTDTAFCKAYTRWYQVAQEAHRLYDLDITVSALLEQKATREQKQRKIDLVDYYFEQ